MTLASVRARRGWVAPVELPRDDQQAAAYVVPVDENGHLFPRYRVEFAKYQGRGSYQTESVFLELQPDGSLQARINGWSVRFQLRRFGEQLVVYEYVGQLTHADFALSLAEIEAETEDELHDLYSREQIAIVGCDPLLHYGGTDALPQTG